MKTISFLSFMCGAVKTVLVDSKEACRNEVGGMRGSGECRMYAVCCVACVTVSSSLAVFFSLSLSLFSLQLLYSNLFNSRHYCTSRVPKPRTTTTDDSSVGRGGNSVGRCRLRGLAGFAGEGWFSFEVVSAD